jgi:hypothetical protein
MKNLRIDAAAALAIVVSALFTIAPGLCRAEDAYLPNAAASKIVTAVPNGPARTGVVILTVELPGEQPDPQELKVFGLLYTYQPRAVFVYRDRPTSFTFWNLQSNEHHDFMLSDPAGQVLMKMPLPQLKKTAVTLTFHKDGLYTFYCTMHQPEMTGQIYVLPPPAP